jgi:preprotein translocase subunit SecG
MLVILITVVHVIVCVFLIAVVLVQSGKSADIAAAFGGMGSQTAFGPRGAATLLTKLTTWCAVIFILTSLSLSILSSRKAAAGAGSVFSGEKAAPAQPKPASPATPPANQPPAPANQPQK